MPPARVLRTVLVQEGYRIYSLQDGWWDCLVVGGSERWLGRGGSEDEALQHAVAQMCPSRAARQLLETRIAAAGELDRTLGGAKNGGETAGLA